MFKPSFGLATLSCGILTACVVHAMPATPTSTKLPTTGISTCGDKIRNDLDCAIFPADYHALQDGRLQSGTPMSYQRLKQNGHDCIKDSTTGLIWEQKTNDYSIRHKDNTYAWYEPSDKANGGNAGNTNDGLNTHEYIKQLNAMNYCGYSDWRLPNVAELRSIVDFGKEGVVIAPIFTHSLPYFYWTSSPDASHKDYAWAISFHNGDDSYYNKNQSHYVRAVRSDKE